MSSAEDPSKLRKDLVAALTSLVRSAKIASGVFRQGYRWDDGTRIEKVTVFREKLFQDELSNIKVLLEKIEDTDTLRNISRLINSLSDLFKNWRNIAYNAFKHSYFLLFKPRFHNLMNSSLFLSESKFPPVNKRTV